MPTPTSLVLTNLVAFNFFTCEDAWRSELVRPYAVCEVLYAILYAFVQVDQDNCIEAYQDTRLYTREKSWCVLVSLPDVFVETARTDGLDDLLHG